MVGEIMRILGINLCVLGLLLFKFLSAKYSVCCLEICLTGGPPVPLLRKRD